jgi:NAD(P)H-nitrite reductase large subunit
MARYVIVGMGVAGVAAAETIRSREPAAHISLISAEPDGYYSRPGLAYFLTGEINQAQLFPFREKEFDQMGVKRIQGNITRIDPQAHQLEFEHGARLAYDRLLIATGAKATPLRVTGSQAQGVVKLDSLEDARQIVRLARKARSAVVVGGGITALELVEGLVARGVKTHYFLRGERYWSNVLDETESRTIEQRLKHEKVQLHYHTDLEEILQSRGRVVGVRTNDGRQIQCDMVAYAIGVQTRKELAVACGIASDRGILVDENLQTSAEDVYAAGDVAQVFDPASGKSVLDSLWGPAREQGIIAGLNMVGLQTPYDKIVPFNVTRLANLTTTIIGTVGRGEDLDLHSIARGDSETWRQLPDAIAAQSNFEVNRLRLLVGQQTLLGAVVMGDQTLSRPLQHLITRRVDIRPIRQHLLQPRIRMADLLADFWAKLAGQFNYAAQ